MTKYFIILLFITSTGAQALQASPTLPVVEAKTQEVGIVINPRVHKTLRLRFKKKYEIFNSKGKSVLKGESKDIDVSKLKKGKYYIKFDGDSNQVELIDKS
jgi:hypothetical protein